MNPTIGSTQHQRAPAAEKFFAKKSTNPSTYRPAAEEFAANESTHLCTQPTLAQPADPNPTSQKVYVVSYDATRWLSDPDDNTLDTYTKCTGVLGTYVARGKAEHRALMFLHGRLRAMAPDVRIPLPQQDDAPCDRETWKAGSWIQSGRGKWTNYVSDVWSGADLVVHVTRCPVDGAKSVVRWHGKRDRMIGGRSEVIDLTGDDESDDEGDDEGVYWGDVEESGSEDTVMGEGEEE